MPGYEAMGGTPNTGTIRRLRDALFFVLYVMMGHKESIRPNYASGVLHIVADWVHFAGFILGGHHFNFGALTDAYAQIVVFLQFRLLNKAEMPTVEFMVAFWAFVFLTAVIVGITTLVAFAFTKRDFKQVWAIKVLALLVAVVIRVFVVSSLSTMLLPWFCDPSTQRVIQFHGVQCYSITQEWLAPAIAGLLATVLLVPFLVCNVLTKVSLRFPRNELLACSVTSFNLLSVGAIVVFVIEAEYLGLAVHAPVLAAAIYLAILVLLEYHLLQTLPYHHMSTTKWQSVATMSLIWLAFCALISAASPENKNHENRAIDYVMILGFLPACVFGYRLATARILVVQRLSYLVQMEADAVEEPGMIRIGSARPTIHITGTSGGGGGGMDGLVRGSHMGLAMGMLGSSGNGDTLGSLRGGGGGCPVMPRRSSVNVGANGGVMRPSANHLHEKYLNNPFISGMLESVHHVEIIGRLLIRRGAFRAAEAWYRAALRIHVNHVRISILYCALADTIQADRTSAGVDGPMGSATDATSWDVIPTLSPSLTSQFQLFCRDMDREQKSATKDVISGTDKLDLLQYVEFQRSYSEAKRYHAKCVDSIQQFWILFLSRRVQFQSFSSAVRTIITNTRRADDFYKQLLSRYPKATHILSSYAGFAKLVLNDTELAETYSGLAEAARIRDEELAKDGAASGQDGGTGAFTQYSRNAVVQINEHGTIVEVNGGALKTFGYRTAHELKERNINILIPQPWKSFHDEFLERFRSTNIKRIIGAKQSIFGLHAQGHAFPMELMVMEMKGTRRLFAGLVTAVPEANDKTAVILINAQGIIQMANKRACAMFDYKPSEMVGNNVSMIMAKEHAAQHDGYLARFLQTGNARVIGLPGRNLMGEDKSGRPVPISLKVEEDMINGEVFFRGTMIDTRDLVAEVFVSSLDGTIRNCNSDALMLFGYDREGIVGQNVNILMPEPYRSFHDGYLERYRRTRVSTIMRATEGRVLPACHNDGTTFTVKLKVKAAGSSFGAGDSLFHAILVRVGDEDLVNAQQLKIDGRVNLDANGTITVLGKAIAATLGYSANSAELSKYTVSSLFPPLADMPMQGTHQSVLEALLATQPAQIRYAIMLRRDRTLIPVSVCGVMNEDNDDSGDMAIQCDDILSKEGLLLLDAHGAITQANEHISVLFGFSADEVQGQSIKFLIPDLQVAGPGGNGAEAAAAMARQSLTGIHQDSTRFPALVELAKRVTGDETNYLLRVTHGPLPVSKLPRDLLRMIQLPGSTSRSQPFAAASDLGSQMSSSDASTRQTAQLGQMSAGELPAPAHLATGSPLAAAPMYPSHLNSPLPDSSESLEEAIRVGGTVGATAIAFTVTNERLPPLMAHQTPPPGQSASGCPFGAGAQDGHGTGHGSGSTSASGSGNSISVPGPKARFLVPQGSSLSAIDEFNSRLGLENLSAGSLPAPSPTPYANQSIATMQSINHHGPPQSGTIPRSIASRPMTSGTIERSSHTRKRESSLTLGSTIMGFRQHSAAARGEGNTSVAMSQSSQDSLPYASSDAGSQSTVNGNANSADSRLILAWKNSSRNPLHANLLNRLRVSLVLLIVAAIAALVVSNLQNVEHFNVIRLAASHNPIVTDIMHTVEQQYYCGTIANASSSVLCTDALGLRLATLATRLADYSAQFSNLASAMPGTSIFVPRSVNLVQFASDDPTVATTMVASDMWQTLTRVAAATATVANITGNPTASRDWQFLVQNKDAILGAVLSMGSLLDDVMAMHSGQRTVFVQTVNFAFIGFAMLTLFAFIWPELHALNKERSKALVLIARMPRHVISFLAYQVYEMDDVDNDNDFGDEDSPTHGDQTNNNSLPLLQEAQHGKGMSDANADSLSETKRRKFKGARARSASGNNNENMSRSASGPFAGGRGGNGANATTVVAQTDYWAYVLFTAMYTLIVIPCAAILSANAVDNVTQTQYLLRGVSNSIQTYTTLYPISAYALELTRPGANWTARAAQLQTAITNVRAGFNSINTDVGSYPSPTAYRSLLQQPYKYVDGVNSPFLANVSSTKGFAFIVDDVVQAAAVLVNAVPTMASSSSTTRVISATAQRALETLLTIGPGQLYLGCETLAWLHLGDFEALTSREKQLQSDMHILNLFLVLVVFYGLYRFQQSMREDIKQNCLLLMMVPQTVIRKHRPLRVYLRSICSEIRRHLGTSAATNGTSDQGTAVDVPPRD
ncbi:hypothetical protein H9P43_007534 [Blastocladiella emersonii ATCC 22665]|nr:hypothetical protein H9P43_007534 [Blastocladiella emersonii ATCC 22665]